MESGRAFEGKMFIDATYEGDLMAKAGVSYHVGREPNAKYGETINGVQTGPRGHHWRQDKPATLVWIEAQDGGDLRNKALIRFQAARVTTGQHRLARLQFFACDRLTHEPLQLRFHQIDDMVAHE